MTIKLAENSLAAFHDGEAAKHLKETIKWEQQADSAKSADSQIKYKNKAQESRQKAIDALETAKIAAGRLKQVK
jgi:hypothetical protein